MCQVLMIFRHQVIASLEYATEAQFLYSLEDMYPKPFREGPSRPLSLPTSVPMYTVFVSAFFMHDFRK